MLLDLLIQSMRKNYGLQYAQSVINYKFSIVFSSISIYMDTINIFVRIATILAGGGNKRR